MCNRTPARRRRNDDSYHGAGDEVARQLHGNANAWKTITASAAVGPTKSVLRLNKIARIKIDRKLKVPSRSEISPDSKSRRCLMKTTRQPLILAVSLATVLALSACGKHHDESTTAAPPHAATAPTMMPAPAATAKAGAGPASGMPASDASPAVTFSSVEVGSTVDANNKVLASGSSFSPKDTIYASVDTSGNGNATLAAKWIDQDGKTVHEDSKTLDSNGPQTTAFMVSEPSGFPAGKYKVDISLNGSQVASKDFSIK
jgi:hypothetical protein